MIKYHTFKNIFLVSIIMSGVILLFFWANMEIMSYNLLDSAILSKAIPISVKNKLCYVNYNDERAHVPTDSNLKMIYFITPTYPRPEQIPELIRLAHTLMHVPRIHWIVADDEQLCSEQVASILRRTGLPYTHIASPKPFVYKKSNYPRGVSNRRAAVTWIRENVLEGVLYFGDDDNTFDLRLFPEIRATKKVSMFPVGFIGDYGVSAPVVNNGKVVAFFDSWPGDRSFPIDMAGFAINIEYLKPNAIMPYSVGHEEDGFLVSAGIKLDDIEPMAENCSKVYVWHTKTTKNKKPDLKININKLEQTPNYINFANLLKELVKLGMANVLQDTGIKPRVFKNHKSYDVNGLN